MSDVRIAMIAAVGKNGAIGTQGRLPWRLPSDFAFYKSTTMGKPLVMGRKTFESIGRPLPGRTSIVVTRNLGFAAPQGVIVVQSLEEAIDKAVAIARRDGVDEVFINGGAEIYRQAIDLADLLYITHVDAEPEGDAFFPSIDPEAWQPTLLDTIVPGEKDSAHFVVKVYQRKLM